MALQTPPAEIHDPMAGWWPSRYGAEDEAGALNEITPGKVGLNHLQACFFVSSTAVNPTLTIIANALRVADHIAGRLGAAGRHGARPEPVTAHA
jgi:hypothetical protein